MRIEINDLGYFWEDSGLDKTEMRGLRVYSVEENGNIVFDLARWENGVAARVYNTPTPLALRATWGLLSDFLSRKISRLDYDNMIINAALTGGTSAITW